LSVNRPDVILNLESQLVLETLVLLACLLKYNKPLLRVRAFQEGQQMKTFILISIGVAVLLCGLRAALLWRDSTNVPWLPSGPEPVDPDIRRAWSDVASYEQSAKPKR
jgi:hypothetical protein